MAPAAKLNLKDKVEDGEIDLSMADLQEVPVKEIANVKKAHSLDLSNNHITILPKNFATLTHLIKLDLSKNQLKELPDNFGDLTRLKHLDLYRNELQHLPLSFSKLKALKWLDLKDNRLVPAIANVSGPCLDNKQCHQCAKDIVNFYANLESKVEEEKKAREQQRQKDLQLNAQKQKQEKKVKKKKEKTKENGLIVAEEKSIKKVTETKSIKRSSISEKRSYFNLILKAVFYVFIVSGLLFLITAAKLDCLEAFEGRLVQIWNNSVHALPTDWQATAVKVGNNFKVLHERTGKSLIIVTDFLYDLPNDESVNIVVTAVTGVFKNVTIAATEVYSKVFRK